VLAALHLTRTYGGATAPVHAVNDVSLTLAAGEFVALVGPSGCGKSTLLHLCGAMDRPSSGTIQLEDTRIDVADDDALTRIRRTRIGFVFQFFNLLPTLTVEENVALPLLLAGTRPAAATTRAAEILDRVGLDPRRRHYPAQLSGGEMQRAALARALVHDPALVIADEPTGNLDSDNGARVLALLVALNKERRITLLLATHSAEVAAAAARVIEMRDGRITSERRAVAAV
jgi:ABC-type lipoprotein export system ATPase subunit